MILVRPAAAGATGMIFVGGSVAVSGVLADAPLLTVQSLRYAAACALLLLYARLTGARLHRPRGAEWGWLLGVTVTGLVVFNLALVHGARHAEPAVLGVAVACVPVLLAVAGRRPSRRVLAAAVVVTLGAGLVQGFGRADGIGLVWAVVVFGCEAAFTLLAVPMLGRHGALGVSVHTTWLAALIFGGLGLLHEGPRAVTRLDTDDIAAGAYLAVGVTAVAFLLWYTCVQRLGAGRAGLLTGIAPIAAAATGVALGGPLPGLAVLAGVACVAAGLTLGLTGHSPTPSRRCGSAELVGGAGVQESADVEQGRGAVGVAADGQDLAGVLARAAAPAVRSLADEPLGLGRPGQ
jgi:drug/metabolite transporter (DMT)-like permease